LLALADHLLERCDDRSRAFVAERQALAHRRQQPIQDPNLLLAVHPYVRDTHRWRAKTGLNDALLSGQQLLREEGR
jgi:hypothetical protein